MATGNMYKNMVEFGHVVSDTSKQTDRQIDIRTGK